MRHVVRSLLVVAAFVCAAPTFAQVVFDAASNTAIATASTGNPIVVTWNHTVGLAKKPYLVVGVSLDRNAAASTVGSVIYGNEAGGPAQTMIFLVAATNGTAERAELWGLANPTPGTHQIQVSVTNGAAANVVVVGGAKSFFNVFQTAATGTAVAATGTSLTPAVAVTNGGFDYVVDAVAYNNNIVLTPGASQTNSYNVTHAAPSSSAAGSAKSGFANTTMSWTATGIAQAWAHVAVPLLPATPQILFDAVASATFSSGAATFTGSWNHSTTSAANRYLIVSVDIDHSGGTASSSGVVYGTEAGGPAQAMTLLGGINNGTNVRA
ncbi:MAG TPA: hypothetical protein VEO74_02835, partial [Thermoanaerobaculia bacterium]|nr:hypothetical protein [Thermoanaerobaculia bacterium]